MTDTLFDTFKRDDPAPAREDEDSFSFMNRVDQPFWARIRNELDSWFDEYPEEDRRDLRARFRNDAPDQHFAAWWELYLHHLFRVLGFEVQPHPVLPHTSARPDFRVSRPDCAFLIEAATTFSGIVDEDRNGPREAWIKSAINSASHPNFFVGLEFEKVGSERPRAKEITGPITAFLDGLDPDEVANLALNDLPELRLAIRDWDIRITPIPVKPDARGKSHRLLGLGPTMGGFVNDVEMLGRTLDRKRKKYGVPDEPFLIAVLLMSSFFEDEDVQKALVGRVAVQFDLGVPNSSRWVRIPDGLWMSPSGPRARHISGLLAGASIQPWTAARALPRIWRNPWSDKSLNCDLPLPRGDLSKDGNAQLVEGPLPAHQLLGLPSDWPGPDPPFAED